MVGLVLHLPGHTFDKLELLPAADDHRRVLAVIAVPVIGVKRPTVVIPVSIT